MKWFNILCTCILERTTLPEKEGIAMNNGCCFGSCAIHSPMESRWAGGCPMLLFGFAPTKLFGNFHQEHAYSLPWTAEFILLWLITTLITTKPSRVWKYEMGTEEKRMLSFHLILRPLQTTTIFSTEELPTFLSSSPDSLYYLKKVTFFLALTNPMR